MLAPRSWIGRHVSNAYLGAASAEAGLAAASRLALIRMAFSSPPARGPVPLLTMNHRLHVILFLSRK